MLILKETGKVGLKSYNVQKLKIRFTLGLNTAKNTHYTKKASNKSCSERNFEQIVSEGICLSSQEWSQGLQRSVCLKSYDIHRREIRITWCPKLPKIRII